MIKFHSLGPILYIFLFSFIHTYASAFSCAHAHHLTCNESYWFAAPTDNHLNKLQYDVADCGYLSWTYDGNDALYTIDVGETPQKLTIRLSGLHANLDLLVFKKCQDHYNAITLRECAGISVNSWNDDEEVVIDNAHGTYYIVVDAYTAGVTSDYFLSITCEDDRPLCELIPELRCDSKTYGTNWYGEKGVTKLLDEHKDCHGWNQKYHGPEQIYKIQAHYGALYDVTIDLKSHGYHVNHDLFLYTHCEAYKDHHGVWKYHFSGRIDHCRDPYDPYSNTESAFVDYIANGQTVYVVVEGRRDHYGSYSQGSFELIVSCGDPCDQKKYELECNTEISGTTKGRRNKTSYYSCGQYGDKGHNWGPEMTYYFDLDEKTDVRLEMTPESSADLNLYLLNDCDQSACLASSKTKGNGLAEIIEYTLWPGRYYVVVEGYQGDAGRFDLRLSGCNCYNSEPLYCDDPVLGNTIHGTHIVNGIKDHCFGPTAYPVDLSGPERIYTFRAESSQTYTFELTGLERDINLFLMDNCKDINSCRGFSTKGWTEDESIQLFMEAGEEILVLVDSRSELITSSYKLVVRCTDEVEDPDDEDPDDEDPGMENPCVIEMTMSGTDVVIDLSAVYDTLCPAEDQSLVIFESANGDEDETSAVSVSISDFQAVWTRPFEAEDKHYVARFTKVHGDTSSVCEVEFDVGPLLTCGMTYSGTTRGGTSDFSSDDIELCYSSKSLFDGPDVLVPFVKTSSGTTIQLTMFQYTDNLSLFILDENLLPVRSPCKADNFNGAGLVTNSGAVGEYFSDASNPLDAGTYYALIEGFAKTIAADFTLTVSCDPDCGPAIDVTCGDVVEATNSMGFNNMDSYLVDNHLRVGYTGPEQAYQFSLDNETEMDIRLEAIQFMDGLDGGIDLFLFGGSCEGGDLIAYSLQGGDDDESIELTLSPGTYEMVVDGRRGSQASYELAILGCDVGAFNAVTTQKSRQLKPFTDDVRAFPNPWSDQLTLQWPGKAESLVRIIAADGRRIYEGRHRNGSLVLKSDELREFTGVVYVQIITDSKEYTDRLIRLR